MPATDLFAAMGVALALSAACLRAYCRLGNQSRDVSAPVKAMVLGLFVLLLLPIPSLGMPLAAFVRGLSADLSITSMACCALSLLRNLRVVTLVNQRESTALMSFIAASALLLYPAALGWGDWDAYRLGWGAGLGTWGFLLGLTAVCGLSLMSSCRVLPALVALSLLAWSLGLLESTNLWDYLLDPWLSIFALGFVFIKSLRAAFIFRR